MTRLEMKKCNMILTEKQQKYRHYHQVIALAQLKAGNTSANLLNEMRQIIYFSCQAKEITKQVYNKIQ